MDVIYDRMDRTKKDLDKLLEDSKEFKTHVDESNWCIEKCIAESNQCIDRWFEALEKIMKDVYNAFTGMFHYFLVPIDHLHGFIASKSGGDSIL